MKHTSEFLNDSCASNHYHKINLMKYSDSNNVKMKIEILVVSDEKEIAID